jgi:HAD superfamily hydrolase (TIGR01509 family)
MMGLRQKESAGYLIQTLKLEDKITPEEYLRQRNERQNFLFDKGVQLMSGVDALVRHLKRIGIKIAVASSSHRKAYELKTKPHQEFFGLFDAVVLGDDAEVINGKPAPDIFLRAAHLLGVESIDPNSCLVFEDAPAGVLAGLAADMRVIWVPDARCDTNKFLLSQPESLRGRVEILKTLTEFDSSKYGIP